MSKASLNSAPVALERDVRPGALVRSRLNGKELVLWRGNSGKIHVWRDNCPHRSVRLSAGRNLGNCLEAVYHGWRFGEDATVISVPAEGGKARPEISADVIASEGANGFVWATLEGDVSIDEKLAGTPLRPVFVGAGTARTKSCLRYIPDTRLVISPWDAENSVIYGVTSAKDLSALRAINATLVAVGRRAEEVAA